MAFWDWFSKNREQARKPSPAFLDEIKAAFSASYPDLCWEVTPSSGSEPPVFAVSAGGDVGKVEDVLAAVAAAPKIPGWRICSFKQRASLEATVSVAGVELGADGIFCNAKTVPANDDGPPWETLVLRLWVPGLTPGNADPVLSATYALLDNTIGEWDAIMKVSDVVPAPAPKDPVARYKAFPLRELRDVVDRFGHPTDGELRAIGLSRPR